MTNLHELYDMFLANITDYRLLALNPESVNEILFGYYKSARAKFYRCKKDLTIVIDEATDEEFIASELTYFEMEILVNLMMVSHITPQLLSSENLKQSLSDKDFKIYSQANQLREIRLLLEGLQSRARKMITEYTYFGLEKESL